MSAPPAPSRTPSRSKRSRWPSNGPSCTRPRGLTCGRVGLGRPQRRPPVTPLAGPGTPLVDEFAPASLAAALSITLDAAKHLIADALELTYRLPRLWALVVAGLVPVWRARAISRETHDLSVEAVAYADRLISATPNKIGQVNATRLVDEARLTSTPTAPPEDERRELEKRGVWVRHRGNPATTDVVMTLDTLDAELFNQTLTIIAAELAALGDTDDARRPPRPGCRDPRRPPTRTRPPVRTRRRPGTAPGSMNLYVHLTPDDLRRDRCGSIEKLGAATTQLLDDWLARHTAAGGKSERPSGPRPRRRHLDAGGRPARPTRRDARALRPARRPLRLPRLPTRLPDLRPRPHHPLHPHGRRRTTRSDPSRQPGTVVPARITGSRPTPPGTTNPSTTAATPGPHPPATSTTSIPPRVVHRHEEPDAPPPRPAPPGPSARQRTDNRNETALRPRPPQPRRSRGTPASDRRRRERQRNHSGRRPRPR